MFARIATSAVFFFFSVCVGVLFTGCEGSEGPAGPVGPQGEQGPVGPQGPIGNANVQVVTFSLTSSGFSNSSSTIQIASRVMLELTADVVSSGAVLAYTDIGTGRDVWTALPFTLATSGGSVSSLSYAYAAGVFQSIILKNTSANLAPIYVGFRVRVVIIPPASARMISDVDTEDFEQVRMVLGI